MKTKQKPTPAFDQETRGIASHSKPDKARVVPVNPPASGQNNIGKAVKVSSKRIGLTDHIDKKYYK